MAQISCRTKTTTHRTGYSAARAQSLGLLTFRPTLVLLLLHGSTEMRVSCSVMWTWPRPPPPQGNCLLVSSCGQLHSAGCKLFMCDWQDRERWGWPQASKHSYLRLWISDRCLKASYITYVQQVYQAAQERYQLFPVAALSAEQLRQLPETHTLRSEYQINGFNHNTFHLCGVIPARVWFSLL